MSLKIIDSLKSQETKKEYYSSCVIIILKLMNFQYNLYIYAPEIENEILIFQLLLT